MDVIKTPHLWTYRNPIKRIENNTKSAEPEGVVIPWYQQRRKLNLKQKHIII